MNQREPTDASARPNVFAYLDYRAFLADWFEAEKSANPRFSHRAFAQRAGHRSPSLLLLVIQGQRNLSPKTCAGFCTAMRLSRQERTFFELLVDFDQASSPNERNRTWDAISAQVRFQAARRIDGEAVRYLSHWYFPAIRELALRADFRDDPSWVARTLRPRITVAQARDALGCLFELELLERLPDGSVRPTSASVVTPHEIHGFAAMNYHRSMVTRALHALDEWPAAKRHFGAVTVAIPPDLVPVLKAEIAAFQERLLDLCDGAELPPEQVYQVNLQLFPLSNSTEESS